MDIRIQSSASRLATREASSRERSAHLSLGDSTPFRSLAPRRKRRRSLWVCLGVLLLTLGLIGPEHDTMGSAFALVDGGHEGTSASGGAHSSGEGGSGPSGAPLQTGGENAPLVCKDDRELNVLFVGNSYTHYFDMPKLLEGMAESAGCRIYTETVAPGGSSLKWHARSGETLGAIGSRPWDAVVLQNFSQLPSQPRKVVREKTFRDVEALTTAIRQNDPRTAIYYYVTWGRRDGDKKYCAKNKEVCTFLGHTGALSRGYSLYAEEFGGTLVDVGGAFAKVQGDERAPFPFRQLYDPDGSHPSLKGSYLAASVFFTALYKTSPVGLSHPLGLTENSARYIQRVAGSLPIAGA